MKHTFGEFSELLTRAVDHNITWRCMHKCKVVIKRMNNSLGGSSLLLDTNNAISVQLLGRLCTTGSHQFLSPRRHKPGFVCRVKEPPVLRKIFRHNTSRPICHIRSSTQLLGQAQVCLHTPTMPSHGQAAQGELQTAMAAQQQGSTPLQPHPTAQASG